MTPRTTESEIRRAIFPGSFNPFTVGHYDIAMRALSLFDELIIGVGVNFEKGAFEADERIAPIERLFEDNPRVSVRPYAGLTADFALEVGAVDIVRGVRSAKDFEYERDMADINSRLAPVQTVVLFARPELAAVSSSVVRELISIGRDVTDFLPKPPNSETKK